MAKRTRDPAQLNDAPRDHPAYKAVRLRRCGHPRAYAVFSFRMLQKGKLLEGKADGNRIESRQQFKVMAESVRGNEQEALRVARLCFLRADAGGTEQDLLDLRKAECTVVRKSLPAEVPVALKKRPAAARAAGSCRAAKRRGRQRVGDISGSGDIEDLSLALLRARRSRRPSGAGPTPLQLAPPHEFGAEELAEEEVASLPESDGMKYVQMLIDMMNARQVVAENRASGVTGHRVYEGIPKIFAEYFARRPCPNVRRRDDRTTKELHRIAACNERFAICKTEAERQRMLRLFVLNFAVWRFVGGTASFAQQVGFLTDWTEAEKELIREVVWQAFRNGNISLVLCDAYASTDKLRRQLIGRPTTDRLEAIFYNTGPGSFQKHPGPCWFTLHGKFEVIDLLWEVAPEVVKKAAPDTKTGRSFWKPALFEIGRVPQFGVTGDVSGPGGKGRPRLPTFFAKEVLQDLVDTPVFPHGRHSVEDLRTFCPVGPGAQLGLMLCFGLAARPPQDKAMAMMRSILRFAGTQPGGWSHGPADDLELHDIQFMLCELQKFFHRDRLSCGLRNFAPKRVRVADVQHLQKQPASAVETSIREALLLLLHRQRGSGGRGRSLSGGGGTAQPPVEDLFRWWCEWQNLPKPKFLAPPPPCSQSPALAHGEWVRLRTFVVGSRGASLGFDGRPKVRLTAVSDGQRCNNLGRSACSQWLLIERFAGHGALMAGDLFWLRGENGSHLGPERDTFPCAIQAQLGAVRFRLSGLWQARHLAFSATGVKRRRCHKGGEIKDNDVIVLYSCGGGGALAPGEPSKVVPAEQQLDEESQIQVAVVVERDPEPEAVDALLRKVFLDGVEAGIGAGTLYKKNDESRVAISQLEKSRKEFVGAASSRG